jgi:hypothetical protein
MTFAILVRSYRKSKRGWAHIIFRELFRTPGWVPVKKLDRMPGRFELTVRRTLAHDRNLYKIDCPFQKFHPAQIRILRQNHRIIGSDVCNRSKALGSSSDMNSVLVRVGLRTILTLKATKAVVFRTQ